jgi:hypothetical protein
MGSIPTPSIPHFYIKNMGRQWGAPIAGKDEAAN